MASVADRPYESTLDDLAGAIRSLRPACPPRETARLLLDYDVPGHTHLVGLDHAATTAVLLHVGGRYAVAVGFDADGLADGGPRIAEFDSPAEVRPWVRKLGAYWGWRHPRYRPDGG